MQPKSERERLFRCTRTRLRRAGLAPELRRPLLSSLGRFLQLGSLRVEELLIERPGAEEEPFLFELLFEWAHAQALQDIFEDLLEEGLGEVLEVDAKELGNRLGEVLKVGQPEPGRARRGPQGAGTLHRLSAEGPRLLGGGHGASTSCPACAHAVSLEDTLDQRSTSRGRFSEHSFACPRCRLNGRLFRYESYRFRAFEDRVEVSWPGLLAFFATREICSRVATGLGVGAVLTGAWSSISWPFALSALVLFLKVVSASPGWELAFLAFALAASLAARVQEAGGAYWLPLVLACLAGAHSLWMLRRGRPRGWRFDSPPAPPSGDSIFS